MNLIDLKASFDHVKKRYSNFKEKSLNDEIVNIVEICAREAGNGRQYIVNHLSKKAADKLTEAGFFVEMQGNKNNDGDVEYTISGWT